MSYVYSFARRDGEEVFRPGPWFLLWVRERGRFEGLTFHGDVSPNDHEIVIFESELEPKLAEQWLINNTGPER